MAADFSKQIEKLEREILLLRSSEHKLKALLYERNEQIRKSTADLEDKISTKDK